MWLSQLGKTIQPSDVLFNLTKFSNTLSEWIASREPKTLVLNNKTKKRKNTFLNKEIVFKGFIGSYEIMSYQEAIAKCRPKIIAIFDYFLNSSYPQI